MPARPAFLLRLGHGIAVASRSEGNTPLYTHSRSLVASALLAVAVVVWVVRINALGAITGHFGRTRVEACLEPRALHSGGSAHRCEACCSRGGDGRVVAPRATGVSRKEGARHAHVHPAMSPRSDTPSGAGVTGDAAPAWCPCAGWRPARCCTCELIRDGALPRPLGAGARATWRAGRRCLPRT